MLTAINEASTQAVYPVSSRMPTSSLWATCPFADLQAGTRDGWTYWNDFVDDGYALANNQTVTRVGRGVYAATAATAGTTLTQLATAPYGVLSLNATTDNEDVVLMALGGANTAGQVVFTSGKKFWFEARIKAVNITDSKFGIFCGLAEEGLCATTAVIGADGALTDKDYVGFHRLEADGDKLDIVYNTAAAGDSPVSVLADAVTLVADTYVKVGIYCDGATVYFYADGSLLGSVALSAAGFPDGEEMAFYFVLMAAHADDASAQIDWIRAAQLR